MSLFGRISLEDDLALERTDTESCARETPRRTMVSHIVPTKGGRPARFEGEKVANATFSSYYGCGPGDYKAALFRLEDGRYLYSLWDALAAPPAALETVEFELSDLERDAIPLTAGLKTLVRLAGLDRDCLYSFVPSKPGTGDLASVITVDDGRDTVIRGSLLAAGHSLLHWEEKCGARGLPTSVYASSDHGYHYVVVRFAADRTSLVSATPCRDEYQVYAEIVWGDRPPVGVNFDAPMPEPSKESYELLVALEAADPAFGNVLYRPLEGRYSLLQDCWVLVRGIAGARARRAEADREREELSYHQEREARVAAGRLMTAEVERRLENGELAALDATVQWDDDADTPLEVDDPTRAAYLAAGYTPMDWYYNAGDIIRRYEDGARRLRIEHASADLKTQLEQLADDTLGMRELRVTALGFLYLGEVLRERND